NGIDGKYDLLAEGSAQSGDLVQVVLYDEVVRNLVAPGLLARADARRNRRKQTAGALRGVTSDRRNCGTAQRQRRRRRRKLRSHLERIGVARPGLEGGVRSARPRVGLDEKLPGRLVGGIHCGI